MKWLVLILLSGLGLWSLITAQALKLLPFRELRQRARSEHNRSTKAIYRLAEFGAAGRFVIWLIGSLAIADLLFIAYNHLYWWAAIPVLIISALIFGWRSVTGTDGWSWRVAGGLANIISLPLSFIKEATESFNRLAARFSTSHSSASVYQKNDLTELLKNQAEIPDNRIDRRDLSRANKALNLSDKTVGQVMIPVREVKWVEAGEAIGPAIMDELHQSGQKRFALVKKAKSNPPEVVGSLYIGDLLKHLGRQAKLRDIMHPGRYFINEASSLEQGLGACLKTSCPLLIVVNGRQEIVGVLPIEKILDEAIGQLELDDFNDYDDIRLAADHEPFEIPDTKA